MVGSIYNIDVSLTEQEVDSCLRYADEEYETVQEERKKREPNSNPELQKANTCQGKVAEVAWYKFLSLAGEVGGLPIKYVEPVDFIVVPPPEKVFSPDLVVHFHVGDPVRASVKCTPRQYPRTASYGKTSSIYDNKVVFTVPRQYTWTFQDADVPENYDAVFLSYLDDGFLREVTLYAYININSIHNMLVERFDGNKSKGCILQTTGRGFPLGVEELLRNLNG